MNIFDVSCFYGPWPAYPIKGGIAEVAAALQAHGITAGFISPLAAVWCRNQQAFNRELLEVTRPYPFLAPVPVLDPTLPTWPDEAECMLCDPRVRAFRVFINYTRFNAVRRDSLDEFLDYFDRTGRPLIVQRRMEDPRYNHHRAVIADTDIGLVVNSARRFQNLKLILGGVSAAIAPAPVLEHPGIYLDTSQMDGMRCIREKINVGLLPRLLFGSHIPLFETCSAFGRVLHDVDDAEAKLIFNGNAARVLGSVILEN